LSNNTKLKKISAVLLIVVMLLGSSTPLYAGDKIPEPFILYETVDVQPISKGVEYTKITRFTSKGWLNFHVLKAELNDNIMIDTLTGKKGISATETLKDMAEETGSIAAVNGDFFSLSAPPFTIGPIIKNSKLLSTPLDNNMGVLYFTKKGTPRIHTLIWNGMVEIKGKQFPLGAVNKGYVLPDKLTLYTPEWGLSTPGNSMYKGVVEIVVAGNRVMEIRKNMPGTKIPEKGFVLAGREKGADFLVENCKEGYTINLNIETFPELKNIMTAIGGGAVLVKKGEIPHFSHNITGYHPRTAVGFSKDGRQMFMVVADGRSKKSVGMTQEELARFMIELGSYYALNLDGGGSSTMVARPPGQENLTILNTVSGSRPRKILNGLGIITSYKKGRLYGLKILSKSQNVALDSIRKLEVVGYDQFYNPVKIDTKDVKWKVSPRDLGLIEKGVFKALKPGKGIIEARIGRIKTQVPIKVLSDPHYLVVLPERVTIKPGEKVEFQVQVVDADGFSAPLELEDINLHVADDIGNVSGNVLTAGFQAKSGAVIASFNGARGGALVRVGITQRTIFDFEEATNTAFLGYPPQVEGGFEIALPELPFDNNAGKLSYGFLDIKQAQAAYLVFPQGIKLPEAVEKLGLWVWGNRGGGHSLKALVVDGNGENHYIHFSKEVNWCGWQEVKADISAFKTPLTLKRIYLVETNQTKQQTGYVYLDNLTVYAPPDYDKTILPQRPKIKDPNQRPVDEGDKKLSFVVLADPLITRNYNLKSYNVLRHILTATDTDFSILAGRVTGNSDFTSWDAVSTWLSPFDNLYVTGERGYAAACDNNRFVFLNIEKGGVRKTDPSQWKLLLRELEKARNDNVFVVLNRPLNFFQDELEKELLINLLSQHLENQNSQVWIVCAGSSDFESYRLKGVHILQLPGFKTTKPHFLRFVITKDGEITYQLQSLELENKI
jgi:hypothetical protein